MKDSKILTYGFLIGLGLLLLNDFYLKDYFHNWWTGKISDFAGLFILPIFLSLINPKKIIWNYIITVIVFAFWKTEISTSTLTYLNNSTNLGLYRVVDYSDFIAFLILPFSYYYNKYSKKIKIDSLKPVIVSLSIFSFYATSAPDMTTEDESRVVGRYHRIWNYETYDRTTLNIGFQSKDCNSCYHTVLGPDIISYGFNEDFIITKINPVITNYNIDTTTVEYEILVVSKDSSDVNGDEEVFRELNKSQFLSKRKELKIPDSVILNPR